MKGPYAEQCTVQALPDQSDDVGSCLDCQATCGALKALNYTGTIMPVIEP